MIDVNDQCCHQLSDHQYSYRKIYRIFSEAINLNYAGTIEGPLTLNRDRILECRIPHRYRNIINLIYRIVLASVRVGDKQNVKIPRTT